MSAATSLLGRLAKVFQAVFRDDVVLQRGDGGVHLSFRDRSRPAAKPPSREQRAAEREQRELQQALHELGELLDGSATLRSTLRHLAFIEQALEKKGWRGLYKVPLDVLQAALRQFEGLVTNWSPAGLACLRSKMAVAVLDRERIDPDEEADNRKTAAVLESPPVVAARAIETARASAAASGVRPADTAMPELPADADESAALMAAYAGLGLEAPAVVDVQGELGSPSAKAMSRDAQRSATLGASDR